jgi:NTP pyrophosphatase (non-canonical NTP hydrolase)
VDSNDYQNIAASTAIYGNSVDEILRSPYREETLKALLRLEYCTDGLTGEAGEFAGEVKKAMRDDGGLITSARQDRLFEELGDVMWYVAMICNEMGWELGAVMDYNLTKLADRKERSKLSGSGDDR